MSVRAKIQEIEEKSASGNYIYRGEPECYTQVSSSLWRFYDEVDPTVRFVEDIQKSILQEARRYAESDKNDFELLAEIQHYGGKTNLIDFTSDHLNALFFACDGFPDKCGRVILLERTEEIREKYRIQKPQTPQHRVIAQKSIFVQPPYGCIEDKDYRVVCIPKDLKKPILKHLHQFHGISTRNIYNDLHGFIKHEKIHREAYTHFGRGMLYRVEGLQENLPEKPFNKEGIERLNDEEIKHLHEEEIGYLNKAIELYPDFAEAYYHRGEIYQLRGLSHHWRSDTEGASENFIMAIEDFSTAIELSPDFVEGYFNRGQNYSVLGDYTRAIADFNRAIQLDPNNSVFYFNRGHIYRNQEDYTRAIADFNRVIQLDPNNLEAHALYVLMQEQMKQSNES